MGGMAITAIGPSSRHRFGSSVEASDASSLAEELIWCQCAPAELREFLNSNDLFLISSQDFAELAAHVPEFQTGSLPGPAVLVCGDHYPAASRVMVVCRSQDEQELTRYLEDATACCSKLKASPIILWLQPFEADEQFQRRMVQSALRRVGLCAEIDFFSGPQRLENILAIARCRRCSVTILPGMALGVIAGTFPALSQKAWWQRLDQSLLILRESRSHEVGDALKPSTSQVSKPAHLGESVSCG